MNRTRATYVVVIAAGAFLAVLSAGCGGHSVSTEAPSDQVAVTLHGYTFGSLSNQINHPWMKVTAAAGTGNYAGWGDAVGSTMKLTFSDGGLVKQVKTLKMVASVPGDQLHTTWFAQDTLGNVHYLKGKDGSDAAYLMGVAVTQYAWLLLRKDSAMPVGATWWGKGGDGRKLAQYKVLSRSSSIRGKSGLLLIQEIWDENGDAVFNTSWTGPDYREDLYFDKTGQLWTMKVGASAGFTLK